LHRNAPSPTINASISPACRQLFGGEVFMDD
jgi:hypothetical protein